MSKSEEKLPYTRINEELNAVVKELMEDFEALITKAKQKGLDIRLHPTAPSLVLYFNDDYPDTLLVDKYFSEGRDQTVCQGFSNDLISRSALLKEVGDPDDGMIWPSKHGIIDLIKKAPAIT